MFDRVNYSNLAPFQCSNFLIYLERLSWICTLTLRWKKMTLYTHICKVIWQHFGFKGLDHIMFLVHNFKTYRKLDFFKCIWRIYSASIFLPFLFAIRVSLLWMFSPDIKRQGERGKDTTQYKVTSSVVGAWAWNLGAVYGRAGTLDKWTILLDPYFLF